MTSRFSEIYKKYGKIIFTNHGTGEVIFDNSKTFQCEFCVFQLSDGDTYFAIEEIQAEIYSFSDVNRKFSFSGITDSGLTVTVQPDDFSFLQRFVSPLIYVINQFKIEKLSDERVKALKFSITNFLFTGDESDLNTLSLNFGGENPVVIQKNMDYSEKEEMLKNKTSIEVTSELIIPISDSSEITETIEFATEICCLLSICRGSRVSWINYSGYGYSKEALLQVFRFNITRPLAEMPDLIPSDSNGCDSTKRFIETAYAAVLNNVHLKKSLVKFCNVFTEARDGRGFTESRGVRMVVLMEMLKEYALENSDFDLKREILDSEQQKLLKRQITKKFIEAINLYIEDVPNIKYYTRWNLPMFEIFQDQVKLSENRRALINNLTGLNHTSFKKIIRQFCDILDVPVTPEDVKKFGNSRDTLIHTGKFYCESPEGKKEILDMDHATWKEFQFLVNFIDKVVLKLFGYSGKYNNFLKWGNSLLDQI